MNSKSSKPKHIVIIMDGNGRWAEQNGFSRSAGHKAGVKTLRNLIEHAVQLELSTITVYAFSRENWQRPKKEVQLLLELFIASLESEVKDLHENQIMYLNVDEITEFYNIEYGRILQDEEIPEHLKNRVLGNFFLFRKVKRDVIKQNEIRKGETS